MTPNWRSRTEPAAILVETIERTEISNRRPAPPINLMRGGEWRPAARLPE